MLLARRLLAALGGVLLLAGRALAEQAPGPPAIVVAGEATVRAAPDRAFVTLAVETRDPSPTESQAQAARAMDAVRKKLRDAGVTDADVRTLAYDVQLEFDYDKGKRRVLGYLTRNMIEVRLDEIERVGKIIDLTVGAGATAVTGVRFDLKERADLEREALRRAVADGRARADAAAVGAGVTVASILRIEEQRGFDDGPRPLAMEMRAAAQDAPETPITAGEIEIRARVTLTAAIQ
jgi:hypothetical protein